MLFCVFILSNVCLNCIKFFNLTIFEIFYFKVRIRRVYGYICFPDSSVGKESTCNTGDPSSIPGLGRSPGEGIGYPLQYSCLENPMDGGAWWATVHGAAKSQTRLSDFTSLTLRASQVSLEVMNLLASAGDKRCRFDPWVGTIPWNRKWRPTPLFLPGEPHGQRSLVGYSPQGHKESDMTEHSPI